jgi:glycosyltransferase involved in cell wall biosynthesis/acyl carrier protein
MQASILVPVFNSRHMLHACLLSLDRQQFDGAFEVVVIDDGSTDGTATMVESLRVSYDLRYHYLPRTADSCRAAARNVGVRQARGDVIVMIDADQVVPPSFLEEHLRFHAHDKNLVVIGPRAFLAEGEIDLDALSRGHFSDALLPVAGPDPREQIWMALSHKVNDMATVWHHMYTCNVSVRRQHVLAVGGFDEGFKGWGLEDSELGYRLRMRRLGFLYNPDAIVFHAHQPPAPPTRYDEWRRNLEYFVAKHPTLDVSLQWILDRRFNPDVRDLTWVQCCLRFEFAARAVQGRLPAASVPRTLEIHPDNAVAALDSLSEQAATSDLLILDHTDDVRVPLAVHRLRGAREVRYFRHPTPEMRRMILTGDPHPVEAPSSAAVVTAIWCDVLQASECAPGDDFFELGGDSLTATMLLVRIEEQLGVAISLYSLFVDGTLGAVIEACAEREQEPADRMAEPPLMPTYSGDRDPEWMVVRDSLDEQNSFPGHGVDHG